MAQIYLQPLCRETKDVDLSTPCGVYILQGAHRRGRGKALSEATARSAVANPSLRHKIFQQRLPRKVVVVFVFAPMETGP